MLLCPAGIFFGFHVSLQGLTLYQPHEMDSIYFSTSQHKLNISGRVLHVRSESAPPGADPEVAHGECVRHWGHRV